MKPEGAVFDSGWRHECALVPCERKVINPMIRQHYLRTWPGVCVLVLAVEFRGIPVGAVVYALPPRETSKRYGATTWELARLWIHDLIPMNAETWAISASVRHIKKHFPDVGCLVSYADPSAGHSGTIYAAANWTRDGRTDDDRKSPRVDYADSVTGKKI